MVYLLIQHKVEDYNKWKPFFDEHGKVRKANGSKGATLYRDTNDPNNIAVLTEWESKETALRMAQSPDLAETMHRAGVIGQPTITFLEHVEKQSA